MPDLSTALLSNTGAIDAVGSVLFANKRSIMGILPDVTIEEHHTDELIITDNPVETGTAISDHAYKMPPEVSMCVGWSASTGKLNLLVGGSIFGGATSLILVYLALQKLQSSAIPLIVSTGKRLYTNMLIKSLSVTTDEDSENALMVMITFKYVNIVKTKTTTIDIKQVANPEATAPTTDAGTVAATPVKPNESLLYQGAQAISGAIGSITSVVQGLAK